MIGTINPIGYGGIRRPGLLPFLVDWTIFSLSSLGAASVFGLALGWMSHWGWSLVGGFPGGVFGSGVTLGLLCLLYSLHELKLCKCPTPQIKRQVRQRRFHPFVNEIIYGARLGVGTLTRIRFTGFYIVLAGALLSGSPLGSAIFLGCFGFGRVLPVLLAGLLYRDPHKSLDVLHQHWDRSHVAHGITLASMGAFLLISLLLR